MPAQPQALLAKTPSEVLTGLGIAYRLVQDEETAKLIHAHGWKFHAGSSLKVIREASFEDTLETYLRASKVWEEGLALIAFHDVVTGDLLGGLLFGIGPTWYNQSLTAAHELCLTTTPKGTGRGISRAAAWVLKGLVDSGWVSVVEAAGAMAADQQQLENAYKKAGFVPYKTFVMETS
ncbi:hypothetical protein DBR00_02485 [Pseudomonas sp. HMWF032]|uniref:hypothetical protein n=1 Tax=Pseudomonas sp. HMWF032 TaxID=2056866 RepID=UPI000D360914|nr:hypothetical protein [Pseudomonas sp. HMWF032]PTS86442.1 hypothetical protein DBR00_02485 [Pseudomonas sp. HMWF032]PTT81369.1 hypothetical protein DBR41_17045 [Pseudomonas sp. HMWF010]